MPWYKYNGGNICDPNSYSLYGNTPPPCPSPKIHLCAIQANDNFGFPALTPGLICQIVNALQTGTENALVLLRP